MTELILKAIVCGYEQGGTTLLNLLLKQHPLLDSGFECGFLLADTPKGFLDEKYSEYNQSMIRNGWGITQDELEGYICNVDNWHEVYLRLREKSRVITDKNIYLVDKTPRYMEYLDQVLKKIADIPIIVIIRDPRSVLWSWIKRRENPMETIAGEIHLEAMCNRYVRYARGYHRGKKEYPDRVFMIKFEDLINNSTRIMHDVLSFIEVNPKDIKLEFSPEYGVYGKKISTRYIDEYKKHLPNEYSTEILRRTKASGFDYV